MTEHLPSTCEALGSVPSTGKRKEERNEGGREKGRKGGRKEGEK